RVPYPPQRMTTFRPLCLRLARVIFLTFYGWPVSAPRMNLHSNLHSLAAWAAAFFLASSVFSHTVALRLRLLIAGTLCALGAAARDRAVRALPPLWLPFVLWAAWSALSLAWSLDLAISEKELRNEIIYTGAALWLCYVAAQARAVQRFAAAVLAGAGALAAA